MPDAAERIGASHLIVLERAAAAAESAEENERGIAFASAALKEVDPAAEPVRAALLLETRATLGEQSGTARSGPGPAGSAGPGAGRRGRRRAGAGAGQRGQAPGPAARPAGAGSRPPEALSLARRAGDAAETQVGALCELA